MADSEEEEKNSNGKQDEVDKANEDKAPPTVLVWSVRGLSLLLILALLAYLVRNALQPNEAPSFTFEIMTDDCEQRLGRWVLPVSIMNEGDVSTHTLTYEVSVGQSDTQEIDLLLLGPREQLTHEFWYDEDPRGKSIECRVISYLLP